MIGVKLETSPVLRGTLETNRQHSAVYKGKYQACTLFHTAALVRPRTTHTYDLPIQYMNLRDSPIHGLGDMFPYSETTFLAPSGPKTFGEACDIANRTLNLPNTHFELLRPDPVDVEQTSRIIIKAFLERDPLVVEHTKRVPLFRDTWPGQLRTAVEKFATQGLSVVIKHDIHGVIMVCLMSPFERDNAITQESPAGQEALVKFKNQLYSMFLDSPIPDPKAKTIEIVSAANHEDFQGLHGADLVVQLAILHARLNGYTEAVSRQSSNSQKISRRLGCKLIGELAYGEFEYDGGKPYKGIKYPKSYQIYWLGMKDLARLGAKL